MKDIFDESESQIQELIDPESIIEIDLDGIGEQSKATALEMIEDISKFYYNEAFMKEHPTFKKRVDTELESLRLQIKMRKADEEMQDVLVKSCCQNPQNASLFKSLTDMQRTIISIQGKIDDIVTRLNNMMKGYQMELNFDEQPADSDEPEEETTKKTFRGTRDFIESMQNREDSGEENPE